MGKLTPTPNPSDDPKPTPPAGGDSGSTENPIDWKAEARKWEQRAKDNKTSLETVTAERDKAAGRVAELETANGTLSQRVQEFESKETRSALLQKVSEETGVDASVLRGSTEEELREHAETLKGFLDAAPVAPVVPGQGKMPETKDNPELVFVGNLFGNTDD